ncbi:MAG TPA: hypothetical protein VKR24_13160 [Candidatus Limnocylindrales bacterium]|nr:hypothetical protein [Candidatus Limnocylindrales bacterium]
MSAKRVAARLIGLGVAGLVVASCAGSISAGSPAASSGSPAASLPGVGTPGLGSPAASSLPAARSLAAVASAPAGWSEVSWSDPSLAVDLPADWTAGDPTVTGDPSMVATLTGDQLKAQQWYDQMVASGAVRFLANGPMPTSQGTLSGGSIDVTVETGDASLRAFADREAGVDAQIGALTTGITSSSMTLAIGPAIRDAYCGQLGDSPPYCEIDELVRLTDGRSLTIAISGSEASVSIAAVAPFADQVLATLRSAP